MLTIVYFHGYGSSPNTPKVKLLRDRLKVPVFAFPADIDPDKAKPLIEYNIDMMLLDNMHSADHVLFVGTSLGGWMASEMAAKYDIPAIVINPSCIPSTSLDKYGVPIEIAAKYLPIKIAKKNVYFFAENDEVLDNQDIIKYLKMNDYEVYVDPEGDHQFAGKPFERVIEYIERKYK